MEYFETWPHRTICEILDEMRKCESTKNYSYLLGLIEEAQSMANRMEASLSDKKDVKNWTKKRHELKEEIKTLLKEVEKLKKRKKELEEND